MEAGGSPERRREGVGSSERRVTEGRRSGL
jgi:hypothetical protein